MSSRSLTRRAELITFEIGFSLLSPPWIDAYCTDDYYKEKTEVVWSNI